MVDMFGPVKDEKRVIINSQMGNDPHRILCRFQYKDPHLSCITAYKHIVVATAEKSLIIYNKQTDRTTIKNLKYQPLAPCFNEAGELLVTAVDSELRKYKVDVEIGQVLNVVWACKGVGRSRGICLMENGFILVCNGFYKPEHKPVSIQPKLHIISQDGMSQLTEILTQCCSRF